MKNFLVLVSFFLSLFLAPNLLASSSYNCDIFFVVQNNGFHKTNSNAQSRCDALQRFFDTDGNCFTRRHNDSRYEHNYRFERGFRGNGYSRNDSRRNAFASYFSWLEDRGLYKQNFNFSTSFGKNCRG